jgi:hypothetical protein
MLEGNNERALIDVLTENEYFKIPITDMIDEQPHVLRKFNKNSELGSKAESYIRMLEPTEKVTIIRIGDTQKDILKIPDDIVHKISKIEKVCAKPELEILLIIGEGLYQKFSQQSDLQPKQFAKIHIKYLKECYDGKYAWLYKYFSDKDVISILKKYKRYKKKTHINEELFLIDYIKKSKL